MRHSSQTIRPISPTHVEVGGPCFITGRTFSVIVPKDGLEKWKNGALIQNALPETSPSEREFLISGISPAGWTETFTEEEL